MTEETEWTEDDVEAARALGWKPPSEWKGDQPPKGLIDDPRRYLERAENFGPFKVMRQRYDELSDSVRKIEAVAKKQIEMANKQASERIEQIKAAQKEAVATGDVEAFERLDKEREAIAPPEPEQKSNGVDPNVKKALDRWVVKNDWFGTDPTKTAVAQAAWVAAEKRGITDPEAILEAVDKQVARLDPPKPVMDSTVEAGLSLGGGSRDGFTALPKEAQEAFDRQWERGMFTQKEKSEAQEWYAKEYNDA